MSKWVKRYMELAEMVATWSKDPSKKVGAVLVSIENNRIVSTGYNGFPARVYDKVERLEDRDTKLLYTVHAELNAILAARDYSLNKCILYTTLFLCSHCMAAIIQSGIRRIITYKPDLNHTKWATSFEATRNMAKESEIEIYELDSPEQNFIK